MQSFCGRRPPRRNFPPRELRSRLSGAIECGEIEPDQRPAGIARCAGLLDAGANPGDQLLRPDGHAGTAAGAADICRSAGVRLREALQIHFGGVAEIHRALPAQSINPGAVCVPGGQHHSAQSQRRAVAGVSRRRRSGPIWSWAQKPIGCPATAAPGAEDAARRVWRATSCWCLQKPGAGMKELWGEISAAQLPGP